MSPLCLRSVRLAALLGVSSRLLDICKRAFDRIAARTGRRLPQDVPHELAMRQQHPSLSLTESDFRGPFPGRVASYVMYQAQGSRPA
jgi:hypothetical protein